MLVLISNSNSTITRTDGDIISYEVASMSGWRPGTTRRLYAKVKLKNGDIAKLWWPDIPQAPVGTKIQVKVKRSKVFSYKYSLDRAAYESEI